MMQILRHLKPNSSITDPFQKESQRIPLIPIQMSGRVNGMKEFSRPHLDAYEPQKTVQRHEVLKGNQHPPEIDIGHANYESSAFF